MQGILDPRPTIIKARVGCTGQPGQPDSLAETHKVHHLLRSWWSKTGFFSVCLLDRVFAFSISCRTKLVNPVGCHSETGRCLYYQSGGKKVYTKYGFSSFIRVSECRCNKPQQRRIKSSRVHRCILTRDLILFSSPARYIYDRHVLLWLGRGTNHGPHWPECLLTGHEYS